MPRHEDFQKIYQNFIDEYGEEEGEKNYYAWLNEHGYDDTKPMPKKEGFTWAGSIKEMPGVDNLIRGKALHPLRTVHPEEWPEVREYLEEELEKSAHTLAGTPLILDHYQVLRGKILGAEYEDGAIEYVAQLNQPEIMELVRNGAIKHCSVEFEWKSLDQVNGVAPRGINFTGLSLLRLFEPGDPLTTVEVWEGIIKELKEAKNVRRSAHPGTSTAKEQVDPRQFIFYVIRDATDFIPEMFSTMWIDRVNGIQAITGRLREHPSAETFQALLFMKANNWTLEKTQNWLQSHPQYLRGPAPAQPGIQPASGVTGVVVIMGKEKSKLKTLEGRVTFLETSKKLEEQELSQEEIKAKIDELTKKRQDLDNQLQQIAEEEQPKRDEIWQQIDLISAELQAYEQALAALIAGLTQPSTPTGSTEEGKAKEAEWDTEYINNLPDSAFAYIEPGGEKDEQEKTTPRALRHLPFKNAQGNIDHDHLVNALARLPQTDLSEEAKAQAKKKLCAAVEAWNSEHEDKIKSDVCGTAEEATKEQQGDSPGKAAPDRAKQHFNISDEDWDNLPDEEKQAYIDKLPPPGTKLENQGNQEPEKDEHGCLIGKERYDEEQDKCVPIATEATVKIVTKMLEATEQAEDLTVEEIKQKIVDLAKQREELDNKLYPELTPPETPLSEEERTTIQAQIDVLYAEIEAYEQALAAKIAGQGAVEKKKSLGEAIIAPGTSEVETSDLVSKQEILALIPDKRVWRSWSYGPQMLVKQLKHKLEGK